jgi:hypothetical protein
MSLFLNSGKEYGGSYTITKREKLAASDLANVASAAVVERGEFGPSICFTMKSGRSRYVPLGRDSKLGIGESVDPAKVEILALDRPGDKTCYKAQEVE